MYGKKVKLRILFLASILISIILLVFLVLKSLEENVVYFQSPSEIKNLNEITNKKIRIGGMVKENSIIITSKKINFIITDFKSEINVTYSGSVPNLFEEGKGVVAEGYLKDRNYLNAVKILAKHDENYMPPEVKEAIGDK
jgi:cytochrome c-type biogenesis protein CcmE|tara:strand:+ start:1362 stop:1781 length:420 start_codon:yes stop_codon:yes gene_type:complete